MDSLIIEPTPLDVGELVVGDMAKTLHVSPGTLKGEIKAEERKMENDRKMNPAKYSLNNDPVQMSMDAAMVVRERHEHPELEISNTQEDDGSFSVTPYEMDDMDTVAQWANGVLPEEEVNPVALYNNQENIENGTVPLSPDSVNADGDMTNTSVGGNESMDYLNSFQPTEDVATQSPEEEIDDVAMAQEAGEQMEGY